jgi:hypothetical protein
LGSRHLAIASVLHLKLWSGICDLCLDLLNLGFLVEQLAQSECWLESVDTRVAVGNVSIKLNEVGPNQADIVAVDWDSV